MTVCFAGPVSDFLTMLVFLRANTACKLCRGFYTPIGYTAI